MVNLLAFAHRVNVPIAKPIADTIIYLDSTDKFPRIKRKPVKERPKVVKAAVADTIRKPLVKVDTSKRVTPIDTTGMAIDTTRNGKDTTKNKDNLEAELKVVATDSIIVINKNRSRYYGKARVTYGKEFELDADFIDVDKSTNMLYASGRTDAKTGRYVGRPISKQGEDQPVTSDSLRVNYVTKKVRIWNVLTQQDGNYISKGEAKKISEDEVAYHNIIFSACDKPDPDYGIVITRGIGEKKRVISGPAYLMIQGIPMPVGLPFGFFPKPDSRSSGLLLPTFGEDANLGFFIRDLGYYIVLSDYADLTNLLTYFSNGSYEASTNLNYMKRYKYNGNMTLSYGSHNYGLAGDPAAKDFRIVWTHSQNPNASPGRTFSASVNAATSSFYQNNAASLGYNIQALTQNDLRSSVSYSRTWDGTPFNLTMSASHSQNISRKTINLEPLSFNFSMQTISPFDKKDRVSEAKWYQKITVGYTLAGTNKLNEIPESELFKGNTIQKKLQSYFQHQIPIGLNLNVFQYFQFNTNFNYQERWFLQTVRKRYARADSLVIDTVPGFKRVGDYTMSAGFSTKIYGIVNFKNSKIKAIRHVITPSIGFSYRPDYSGLDRSYNRVVVSNATVPYPVVAQRYSIFDGIGAGGPGGGTQAGISLGIDNNFEAKVRPGAKDTVQTDKKVMLLQGFTFNTFYNFAADSFKLSPISFSGHTGLFKDKINVSFGGSFNPYTAQIRDSISNGQIVRFANYINRYSWHDGKFPTLTNFNFSVSGSLNPAVFHPQAASVQPNMGPQVQMMSPAQQQQLALLNNDPSKYIDFNIPWNIVFNYSFNYSNNLTSTTTSNTIMFNGDVSLTPKWKIQYNTNFDLKVMRLSTATSFAIYRDLHCWDLSIQWVPFGYYKSYNVTLRVKSAILQALKLTKRSDFAGYGGGQF